MVHRIVLGGVLRDRVIDAIGLGDRRDLLGASGEADDARVELRHVRADHIRRIPRRIDADEQHPDPRRLVAERVERRGESGERRRAGVRAEREAEEHQLELAGEVGLGHRLARTVDQGERAADHDLRRRRRRLAEHAFAPGQGQQQGDQRRRRHAPDNDPAHWGVAPPPAPASAAISGLAAGLLTRLSMTMCLAVTARP